MKDLKQLLHLYQEDLISMTLDKALNVLNPPN